MITLPTHELLNMIGDMLPFVDTDKDSIATHCVRVEQKGDLLTMLATNRAIAARVSWSPDDGPVEVRGDFDVRISPADAKAIVSAFKLPSKLDWAPVEISVVERPDFTYRLEIARPPAPDMWPALTLYVDGRGIPDLDAGDTPEIDIHRLINDHMDDDMSAMLSGITLTPRVLVALGKVERHGSLKFHYRSTRDGAPFYVKAGAFDAVAFPVRELPGGRIDVLRDGAGVLAGSAS